MIKLILFINPNFGQEYRCTSEVEFLVDKNVASGPLHVGSAVSITSGGNIRSGGGTSIYTNIGTLTATCPTYLDIEPVYEDMLLLSYFDQLTGGSILSVMILDEINEGVFVSSTPYPHKIYEIATLSQSEGTFMGISQDTSPSDNNTAVVFIGKVSSDGKTIAFGAPVVYTLDEYSLNPACSRLSDTSFAITYYNNVDGLPYLSTRAGFVALFLFQCTLF